MALDPKEGLFEFTGFAGLRNTVDQADFGPGDLAAALNVDVDDALNLNRRKGYSAPITTAIDRDLFASGGVCLGVGGDALKRLLPDNSVQVLRTGLLPNAPLSYAVVGARAYYSNGAERGVVDQGVDRSWGLPVPPPPQLAVAAGALRQGRYQVVVTYLRADGQESGAGLAGMITLPERNSGIVVTMAAPVTSDVDRKVVYMTTADGETLYRAASVPAGVLTVTLLSLPTSEVALATQFLSAPPAGQVIAYGNGRMLVAQGSILYPSEPYAPELFDRRRGFPFTSKITMLAPLIDSADGLWVGTESQVIWLSGSSPDEWEMVVKAEYGVLPGGMAYADGELLADGASSGQRLVYFATNQGLCVGRPGGGFTNLTTERFNYPSALAAAGIVRRHRGTAQYLATLRGTGPDAANEFV